MMIHYNDEAKMEEALEYLKTAYRLAPKRPTPPELIVERVAQNCHIVIIKALLMSLGFFVRCKDQIVVENEQIYSFIDFDPFNLSLPKHDLDRYAQECLL